jgi:FtsP/CotA-like multicopper oxidase with cupredoxin domain
MIILLFLGMSFTSKCRCRLILQHAVERKCHDKHGMIYVFVPKITSIAQSIKMRLLRAPAALVALLCGVASAGAAELQPPTLLRATGLQATATSGATNPPGASSFCPSLPVAGSIDAARLVIRNTFRPDVGPYTAQLSGYATDPSSSAQDSYRPLLVTASPGDTLRFDVVNQLAGSEPIQGVVNLHTHGLIVSPRPCTPLSDYSFVGAMPGSTTSYRIDIPATLPGYMFGTQATPAAYPSGLNWFHSHLHGRTAADVMQGQSGMLYVGDLRADLLATPNLPPASAALLTNADIRYLGLRDIQLAVPAGAEPDRVPPGVAGQWTTDDAYNTALCPGEANPPQPAAPGEFSGPGYCGQHGADPTIPDTVWMFTVNGQYNPTITMAPGRNQIWRVANLSADLTYVLELVDDASGTTQPMDVLSLDGLAAGTSSPGSTTLGVGVTLRHVLMMPGARTEIFVPNIAGHAPRRMTLRTSGFTSGIPGAGDLWPRTDLAQVAMQPSAPTRQASGEQAIGQATDDDVTLSDTSSVLPAVAMPNAAPTSSTGMTVQTSATPATPPNCISIPPGSSARRRITYLEDGSAPFGQPQPFTFGFKSEVVGPDGQPIDNRHTIAAQAFPMQAMLAPNSIPHLCPRLNTQEIWELVNTTGELHNFHIHQNKFRLAVQTDLGAPANLVAVQDPTHLISGYEPEVQGAVAGQTVDAWHDTLPVPPALLNADGSVRVAGRTFITIPFFARQQVGDFPFHCHILDHEDYGMMGVVQVYDPTQLALITQESQLAELIQGSICRVP